MPVFIVGGLLAALGVAAALLLLIAPLGVVAAASAGASLWILFPLFTLLGYVMMVIGGRDPASRAPTALVSSALLLLCVAAAVVLVVQGAGLVALHGAASVWYVLVLAGIIGSTGSAASTLTRAAVRGA
jgi:hypothetical protein